MKRWNTPWLRRASLLAASLVVGACVTRGAHEEVVRDRDRLRDEVDVLAVQNADLERRAQRLEAGSRSLGGERVALIEELEELREANAALERRLYETERELVRTEDDLSRLRDTYDELVADLESELEAGRIEVQRLREGMRLHLPSDVLFGSGSAELTSGADAVLSSVAKRLKSMPHQIRVEGHTDAVPIRDPKASRFPSNWELAGARAASVVRWLAKAGVDPGRLSAVSYGAYRPIATNETREGRSRNRRIEIVLTPDRGNAGSSEAPVASGPRP